MSSERTSARTWSYLGAVLLFATGARLVLGFVYFGFHTGDDVEILQAGFLHALGWPYHPWEIRNLLLSDVLVAPGLEPLWALGVHSTRMLLWMATFPFVVLATINAYLVYRLALGWLHSEGAAVLASGLYAFHWLPLGYGSTVYPRTASTTCVLLAAFVLWDRRRPPWGPLLAGALVAVAWAFRYSEVIFAAPLLVVFWLRETTWRRRVVRGAAVLGGFVATSLLTVGLEDWLTWGRPFASLMAFARYTLLEGGSSSLVPDQPWYWYLWRLPKWLPLTLLPLLWRAQRIRGAVAMSLCALLPLLALSGIHHKELRYLQGIMPFVMILAAGGARSLWSSGRRRPAAALAASSLVLGLGGLSFLATKSMAAVAAAEGLRSLRDLGPVCLAQPWAYGGTLYLGPHAAVRELPYPLSAGSLAATIAGCRWLAVYAKDLERDEGIPKFLEQHGCDLRGEYRRGRSKPVLVFHCAANSGRDERGASPLGSAMPGVTPRSGASPARDRPPPPA